jgi:hypothetical protein
MEFSNIAAVVIPIKNLSGLSASPEKGENGLRIQCKNVAKN